MKKAKLVGKQTETEERGRTAEARLVPMGHNTGPVTLFSFAFSQTERKMGQTGDSC